MKNLLIHTLSMLKSICNYIIMPFNIYAFIALFNYS